ncbi:hypothetical protein HK102_013383 [Quaeritorhiza haematococci]|nr:hypothetical protein HK102_013383 [Quaeritorhiza haematococci]
MLSDMTHPTPRRRSLPSPSRTQTSSLLTRLSSPSLTRLVTVFILIQLILGPTTLVDAYKLEGCFTFISAPPPSSSTSTSMTVQSCVDQCITSAGVGSFALLQGPDCRCVPASTGLSQLSARNIQECSAKCVDELPCGELVQGRFSVYSVVADDGGAGINGTAGAGTVPPPSATGAPTASTTRQPGSSTSTSSPGGPIVAPDESVSTTGGSTSRVSLLWLLVGCAAGLIVIGAAMFIAYKRHRKRQNLQTLPRLEPGKALAAATTASAASAGLSGGRLSGSATGFLIPGLLPLTPSMIYSVVTSYQAQRGDEIDLHADDVVAVQHHFADSWAVGTNVTTGQTGAFPLGCLVTDEKWIKTRFQVSERKESLTAVLARASVDP